MQEEYQDILNELGKNIRKARKKRGLIQLDIEVASGITAGDISKIENGQINIAFTTLVKIARAMDVELNELFPISDNK